MPEPKANPSVKIAIVGAHAAGKTHLVNTVLFKALISHDDYKTCGFRIYEHGVLAAYRNGAPMFVIGEFCDLEIAAAWLKLKVGAL